MTLFISRLLEQNLELSKRVELLCLRDVEFRIVNYLARLSQLVPSSEEGYKIPITQLELASAIGATRETTSTTLNQLERRSLLKLGRRNIFVLPALLSRRGSA